MTFGERLRELREDNDEKQKDIAELVFVSNKVISDYERGIHFPRDEEVIIRLAKHFNVTTDYILGASDKKNNESISDFVTLFLSLDKEQKQTAMEFMRYLADKNRE